MAYSMAKQRSMINSISLEKQRCDTMTPFFQGEECDVLELCMDDNGMSTNAQDAIRRAKRMKEGFEAIGTDISKVIMAMDSVKGMMDEIPRVHRICGLSNIS
jgi:cobalamin-dependent methionine synthase I